MIIRSAIETMQPYSGIHYINFLKNLAEILNPASYLEIGTNKGVSLEQIECDVVCIDPKFMISGSPLARRRRNLFYQMTSDEFFAEYDVLTIFPRGVDLAFLDGMHRFEYLLRDVINVERCCHRRSLILLHDCLPLNVRMAERSWLPAAHGESFTGDWWTGDVWRILPTLKKHRPDLQVRLLDCPPTGLVVLSNLDAGNTVLDNKYFSIIEEFTALNLVDVGIKELWSMFPIIESRSINQAHTLTSVLTVR